jgi:4-hydroxy-3-methylbut-2-enyl diphosphate reductase IspH
VVICFYYLSPTSLVIFIASATNNKYNKLNNSYNNNMSLDQLGKLKLTINAEMHTELVAFESRLLAEIKASEARLRADLAASETRLRTEFASTSSAKPSVESQTALVTATQTTLAVFEKRSKELSKRIDTIQMGIVNTIMPAINENAKLIRENVILDSMETVDAFRQQLFVNEGGSNSHMKPGVSLY